MHATSAMQGQEDADCLETIYNPHFVDAENLPAYGLPSTAHAPAGYIRSTIPIAKVETWASSEHLSLQTVISTALRALVYRYRGQDAGSTSTPSFHELVLASEVHGKLDRTSAFRLAVGFASRIMPPADAFLALGNDHRQPLSPPIWHYREDRFSARTIKYLDRHLTRLLYGILSEPDAPVSRHDILAPQEVARALREWNDASTSYPRHQSLVQLFTESAEMYGDAAAIVHGDRSLTYRELNQHAGALASYLVDSGVRARDRVGIALDRSAAMVVAMLAILRAGAAYVPLDVNYPVDRIRFMIEDSDLRTVITDRAHADRVPSVTILLNIDDMDLQRPADIISPAESRANSAAYVMYTSGSTGRPKGVEITHQSVVRLVKNTNYVELGPDDVLAQISNASFDAITFEVWGALLNGGRVAIIPSEVTLSPDLFADALQTHGITVMFLTSALFTLVASHRPSAFTCLRYLLVGGEAVSPRAARQVLAGAPPRNLINAYGPTESTTFALTHLIENVPENATSIPIGRPIANTQAYILDAAMRPVPVGVSGFLYLGGDGLATRYLNQPEITAERFIPNVFNPEPGQRLYRTGDIALYRADGVIEYIGREDDQVKIRGFRIEPAEIAMALSEHADVEECEILVDGSGSEKRLLAYVAAPRRLPSSEELRRFLEARLPAFMVPTDIMSMPRFPLTPNGKVDRVALLSVQSEPTFTPDRDLSGLYEAVAAIWRKVLRVNTVDLDQNFFDLGGDSLRLAIVASELKEIITTSFSILDLFRHTTIRSFVDSLQDSTGKSGMAQEARSRAAKSREMLRLHEHPDRHME